MYILGIESSCDETALAVIESSNDSHPKILSEEISSQVKLHELYGGVVPELASREHLKNLPLLLEKVLSDSKINLGQLSAIGVTRGPGLKGCLLMGSYFAHGLSQALQLPLLGINHIEGHLLAPMLDNPDLKFPYLCLIVSGGHTEIQEVSGLGQYKLIARTLDDAAGEAFDKSANLLGLPYPGGPRLAALADSVKGSSYVLPKVMRGQDGFSFSGLKTAISLLVKKEAVKLGTPEVKAELAFAIQRSIVETLIHKVKEAVLLTGVKTLALSGGVAANACLRREICAIRGTKAYLSLPQHSTDNAAMIAYVAALRFQRGERLKFSDGVLARWPVEELR